MNIEERYVEPATNDVEGHGRYTGADPQAGEDDVEGHGRYTGADPQAGEDDVEGHGYKGP